MESRVLLAINILFVIAAFAPLAFVVLYRWAEVPRRRAEIEGAFRAAFSGGSEAEQKADRELLDKNPYVSDLKQTFDRFHSVWRYLLPSIILVVLTLASSYVGYSWTRAKLVPAGSAATQGLAERLPLVVIMALAGGLVWCLYEIASRTRAGDFGPPDLYEIDLRLLAAVPIGYAFSLVTAKLEGLRSFMAFAAAAFPFRDTTRMIRQFATRRMLGSESAASSRPAERHLGAAIDGVSDAELARLGELGVVTALDMAYSDPVRIMVQTGFPLPVITDWIDQALWAVYVGDLKDEMNKQGIRCSLDVCEFVSLHLRDGAGKKRTNLEPADKAALAAVAEKMKTTPELLQDLFFRICNDPQVAILQQLWYPRGVPKELKAG